MGQKINPISLRLENRNRYFDSCWYSDYYYSEGICQDLKTREYLDSFLKQIDYPSARIFIQSFQKVAKIFVFFCSPKKSRERGFKFFNLKHYNRVKKSHKKKKRNSFWTSKMLRTKSFSCNKTRPFSGLVDKKQKGAPLEMGKPFKQTIVWRQSIGRSAQISKDQIFKNFYFRYRIWINYLLKSLDNNNTNKKKLLLSTIQYSCLIKKKLILGNRAMKVIQKLKPSDIPTF